MEKRRGTWMAHGTTRRVLSKQESLQPNDVRMREMILNLMAIVGLIFLVLLVLHVFFGFSDGTSFRVYVAIFLTLECTVISARLCICLKKKMLSNVVPESPDDVEKTIQVPVTESTTEIPFHLNFTSPSYESIATPPREFHDKRNSF